MSFDDPFDDFKRKQQQPDKSKAPAQGPGKMTPQERLEKISDYFPAVNVSGGEAAPQPDMHTTAKPVTQRGPGPDPHLMTLCNILRTKGVLTLDEVRRIFDIH